MKQTDMKILQALRENARASLTTISKRTGVPVSTIYDRIRGYERRMIHRFTALLDFRKLGFEVRATILVKVAPQHREHLRNFLFAHARVNTLARVNNGYDYAADCVFIDIREAEEFMQSLELQFQVMDKLLFHIIDDIVREKLIVS